MSRIEVLVEGPADVPVMREILKRRFALSEPEEFRIHAHGGRGELAPLNRQMKTLLPHQQKLLLNALPRKLYGYAEWLSKKDWVLVVVDADSTPCEELLNQLQNMLVALPKKPRVLFRIAIEETESWFIADTKAIKKAYPNADVVQLKKIKPDAICGAWENLMLAIKAKSKDKPAWAETISPYLDLDNPASPSLQKLLHGIERELAGKP